MTRLNVQRGIWYGVLPFTEQPVPQFTDAILDHPQAGNPASVFYHWLKIKWGTSWAPANPDDPNAIGCCEGTVDHMTVADDGDIVIYVTPDDLCRKNVLQNDKGPLVCELPWSKRNNFRKALKKLKPADGATPGTKVRICGYWIIDAGHDDHKYELHPVTSILPRG